MKLFKFKKAHTKQTEKESAKPCAPALSHHANAEFIARVMDEHGDMVLRLALSQMRDMPDAEDVFQDVFVRLMNARMDFTSSEHLKAWLLRTTVNRCHDLQRVRGRKEKQVVPLSERHAETLHDRQAVPPGFEPDIWHAVGTLPEDQRMAVHLHYIEGYSTEEIARVAHCAPATIRTRLFRAREALRCELEGKHVLEGSLKVKAMARHEEEPPPSRPDRNSGGFPHDKQQKRLIAFTLPKMAISAPSEGESHER